MNETPLEIWHKIFEDVPQICFPTIFTVNRAFSRIIRPYLFATFTFRPVTPRGANEVFIEEQNARFDFWTSPDIAALVHSCKITTFPLIRIGAEPAGTPNEMARLFFCRAKRFSALRHLIIHQVDISEHYNEVCTAFASLQSFDLWHHATGYDLERPVTASRQTPFDKPALRLQKIRLALTGNEICSWTPLFHSLHLRELYLDCPIHAWCAEATTVPEFPRVVQLSINILRNQQNMEDFAFFLPKFQALQSLSFLSAHRITDIGSDALAHLQRGCCLLQQTLEEVNLPLVFLPTFMPVPDSTFQCLMRINVAGRVDGPSLSSVIQVGGQVAPNIISFTITLSQSRPEVLRQLFSSFPHLQELKIDQPRNVIDLTQNHQGGQPDILDVLAGTEVSPIHLPQHLRTLVISWADANWFESRRPRNPQALRRVLLAILARLPSLTSLSPMDLFDQEALEIVSSPWGMTPDVFWDSR
ncbi:hypothetical protein MIND_00005100 [Mycena indigotica]|uniref:F-box domain-containing protein n=1 Tax=Mycena indigotica TaxID=2126181 RepID=A0A8H6WEK6_9AGAR|nr:uncharacterized protein MIND_00005100 [Mycena indigotica]KAF7314912.1 hypothetical protein MIND_00005100 [Mycena indigotica]